MTEFKFKVGDRVHVPESRAHGWGGRDGTIIEKAYAPYEWRVEFKGGNGSIPGPADACFYEDELEKLEPKEGELFKPGDVVECKSGYNFEPCTGTVVGYTAYDKPSLTGRHGYYEVKVEGEDRGDPGVDGAWAYYESELKLAEPERTFQEGDRVTIVQDLEGDFPQYVGKTGTVAYVDDEEPDGYIYSVKLDGDWLPILAHPDELELAPTVHKPFVEQLSALMPVTEEELPVAAPDPDAPDWERQANRRLALELAVKSAEGLRAGRGNIVGRARAFERFLNGEGE